MNRRLRFAALLFTALAPTLAWASEAQEAWDTEFTRHVGTLQETLWWDAANGEALGAVQRPRWTQPLRAHVSFYDTAGTLRAQGVQPWGLGVVVPGMAELQILDGQGQGLGMIQGGSLVSRGGRFKLFNSHETHVADAWVDANGDEVIFAHPRGQVAEFARLTRRPYGHQDATRWHLSVQNAAIIADEAWPVIVAFFSNKLGATVPPEAKADPEVLPVSAPSLPTLRR